MKLHFTSEEIESKIPSMQELEDNYYGKPENLYYLVCEMMTNYIQAIADYSDGTFGMYFYAPDDDMKENHAKGYNCVDVDEAIKWFLAGDISHQELASVVQMAIELSILYDDIRKSESKEETLKDFAKSEWLSDSAWTLKCIRNIVGNTSYDISRELKASGLAGKLDFENRQPDGRPTLELHTITDDMSFPENGFEIIY